MPQMETYLDHAASTPMRPEAIAAMREVLEDGGLSANPSSAHATGKKARAVIDRCRAELAERFECEPGDVVFNSGGSEGDTHALLGAAWSFDSPCHIAISAIEHEAIEVTAKRLQKLGHTLSTVPVSPDGVVRLDAIEELLRNDPPDILSVMAINNEIGTVQPVCEIAALCRHSGVMFHSDAVRAVGHGLPDIERCPDITILNATAHKFGGPRGVGFLIQRGIKLPQLICGGGQEHGARAGTENVPGIAAMVAALAACLDDESAKLEAQRADLEARLKKQWPGCVIHGEAGPRATHVTSVALLGSYNRDVQAALSSGGIYVGTGKACHDTHAADNSGVLGAMGVPIELQRATLRISLGWSTTQAEVDILLAGLQEIVPAAQAAG
jgi:cysteine desulfurase